MRTLRIHYIGRHGKPWDVSWPEDWPIPRKGEKIALDQGMFYVEDIYYIPEKWRLHPSDGRRAGRESMIVVQVSATDLKKEGSFIDDNLPGYEQFFPEDRLHEQLAEMRAAEAAKKGEA